MADQDAVAAFKVEGDVDQITLHTKQAIANPSIPIQASSLERLEEAEADKFEQTRGGGAYADKWTGRWGKWQGWLGGSSGTTLDALLVTASSQVGSTSWFAKLCNLRYLINILNVF
ncbi:TPA: hypothetical protein ACH3X3_011993 [Trebouxia sp. C0006]